MTAKSAQRLISAGALFYPPLRLDFPFGWTRMIRVPDCSPMHYPICISRFLFFVGMGMLVSTGLAQTTPAASVASAAKPYKIVNSTQALGTGGIDYVHADNDGRRLYVPRGDQVLVFDLDTLKSAGAIPNARARGRAVDPKSHHRFCSSSPVV